LKIHIVQKGDTLWEIAQKYDVDFDTLVQLNAHLASPEMIMPGMKIKIPTNAKTIKKDGKKFEEKIDKTKKEPAYKEETKPQKQQPKKIEVPKMPKLHEEKAVTLPSLEGESEYFPTTIFPEMPVEKEKKKPHPPKKDCPEKKSQPQQQMPAYQMPEQYTYPCHPQMMPAYYYPVMMPPYMGCGCRNQQMHMPYYPYHMDPRQYSLNNATESYPKPNIPYNMHHNEQQLYPAPPSASEKE